MRKAIAILVASFVIFAGLQSSISASPRFKSKSQEESGVLSKLNRENISSKFTFSIDEMSPYVVQNQPIKLTISTAETEAVFRIETLTPTNTRSELYSFADDLGKGRVKDSVEIPLSSFTPSPTVPGQFSVEIPIASEPESSLSFGAAGVYPVAISQIDSTNKNTQTQYSFITNVPTVGSNGSAYSQKLSVVPLIEFAPSVDRASIFNEKNQITDYGIGVTATFAKAQSTYSSIAPIISKKSLLLSPESLDTYSFIQKTNSKSGLVGQLFSTPPASNFELITDTYVPINIAELEKLEALNAYSDLLTTGRSKITQYGFSAPSRSLVTQSISNSSIEDIARTGIDNVIVDEKTFARNEKPLDRPVVLSQNSATLKIAAADTSISPHLSTELSSSAKANFLIGATSVIALEAPSTKRGLILPLDLSKLDKTTLVQFLNASISSPLIETSTTDGYFSGLSENKALSKKLAKTKFPKDVSKTISKTELSEIEKYSRASQSMFDQFSKQSNIANWMGLAAYSRADRNAERYISSEKARALTLSVQDYVALPEKRTLTITSRESKIPVTLRNTSGRPISVVVSISSDKLAFPEGTRFPVLLKDENTTVQIKVKARASGSFPVSIEILSPKESISVAKQSATVRSTVVSGSGVAIAIASTAFLALWWISHWRRSKKKPIAPVIELNQENAG